MSIRTSIRFVLVGFLLAAPVAVSAAELRAPVADRHGLVLAGKFVGFALAAEGGHARGVVVEVASTKGVPNKHLSGFEYTPLVVRMGAALDPVLLAWISDSLAGKSTPQTLQLVKYDFENKPIATRELRDALLTGVTLPLLEAGSKEVAALELEVTPGSIVQSPGGVPATLQAKTKAGLASAFRVKLGDLPAQRVPKVGAVRWSRPRPSDDLRDPRLRVGLLSPAKVGDLELHVSRADAPAWEDFYTDFVVLGKNGSDQELDGSIELLTADQKSTILTVKLSHAGPFALEPGGDPTFVVRLYLEGIALEPGPAK
jgi:hypothetical protein